MNICDGTNPIPKPEKGSLFRSRHKKKVEYQELKKSLEVQSKPRRAPIGAKLRAMVFERDGHKCTGCGRGPKDTHADGTPVVLECDHVIPVAAGGTNCESNLRTRCNKCNVGRGARMDTTPTTIQE